MNKTRSLRLPFDTHVHGRQGDILRAVAPLTAEQNWGAIFEPNLTIPITTSALARAYQQEVHNAATLSRFRVFVLAYFTDTIDPDELARGCADGDFIGLKFYPRGATTNSESGVVDVRTLWTPGSRQYRAIQAVHAHGKVVQLHCEVNYNRKGKELDPYDKEKYFFAEIMPRLLDAHTGKFSAEHLSTKEGALFIRQNGGERLGASITPHHLLLDRRDMFRGGLRPHHYCLPVVQREKHRLALLELATSGHAYVYAGSDSAPHDRRKKESECCSGGVFGAHAAIECYAEAFEQVGALDKLEPFLSVIGPKFYGLSPSPDRIQMIRRTWTVDTEIAYSNDPADRIRPFGYETDPKARREFHWKVL